MFNLMSMPMNQLIVLVFLSGLFLSISSWVLNRSVESVVIGLFSAAIALMVGVKYYLI